MTLSAQWIRHTGGLAHNGGQLINSVKYSVKCSSLNKGDKRIWNLVLLLFFLFVSGHVCIILFYWAVCFSCCDLVLGKYQRRGSSHFQPFYFSTLPPYLFCHIPSFVVRLVSSPIQQWGGKLHFSWNVSCCKAPAGVIFFAEVKTSGCICCISCM